MYQKLVLVGRLGNDPEMRYSKDGKEITKFRLAISSYSTKDGERKDETTWFSITVFGKQAEACNNYLAKGSIVLVEGRLQADPETGRPRMWEKDGRTNTSFEVVAADVRFLSPKAKDSQKEESQIPEKEEEDW